MEIVNSDGSDSSAIAILGYLSRKGCIRYIKENQIKEKTIILKDAIRTVLSLARKYKKK